MPSHKPRKDSSLKTLFSLSFSHKHTAWSQCHTSARWQVTVWSHMACKLL